MDMASSRSPLRFGLTLVAVRAVVLVVLGLGVLGEALTGGNLFGAGWRSFLWVFLVLGVADVGGTLGLGLLRVANVSLRELGWRWEGGARHLARGLLGFVAAAAVLVGVCAMFGGLGELWQAMAGRTLSEQVIFAAIGIFGGALVEESLYRGYLQPAMIAKLGTWGGIAMTALVFDVAHLNFRPPSLIAKFLFGVIFGVLRERDPDRSLFSPAIAHALVWIVFGA
jgi:membrane protease YdiL (CAAX protease family)